MPRRKRPARNSASGLSDPLFDSRPAATLDLHGYSRAEAAAAVRNFIATWRRRAPGSVVHVITGKGRRSSGPGVLGPAVRQLIQGELRNSIVDWSRDLDDGGYLIRIR